MIRNKLVLRAAFSLSSRLRCTRRKDDTDTASQENVRLSWFVSTRNYKDIKTWRARKTSLSFSHWIFYHRQRLPRLCEKRTQQRNFRSALQVIHPGDNRKAFRLWMSRITTGSSPERRNGKFYRNTLQAGPKCWRISRKFIGRKVHPAIQVECWMFFTFDTSLKSSLRRRTLSPSLSLGERLY